jgi:transposase
LNTVLERELTAGQRRRAEVVVLYAAGWEGADIAQALAIHVNTVYSDLKAFERDGLEGVHHPGST